MGGPLRYALHSAGDILIGILKGEDIFTTTEGAEARLRICEGCQLFDQKSRRCEKCLCYMDVKSIMKKAQCPEGKWGIMITMDELLNHKYKLEDQSDEIQANLTALLAAVNKVRSAWGQSMTVTSGLRTMADHLRIYQEKAQKAGVPFDKSKVPMKSKHLIGAGADIADPGLKLTTWLKANPKVLEDAGLFCEEGNSNWVHLQTLPFGSYRPGGSRWFNP